MDVELKQLKEEALAKFSNFLKNTQVDNKIIHHVCAYSGDYIGYLDDTFIPEIAYLDFETMDEVAKANGFKVEYYRTRHEFVEYKM